MATGVLNNTRQLQILSRLLLERKKEDYGSRTFMWTDQMRGEAMEKTEFSGFRNRLGKTQKQLAGLLGMSIKAIHSYEQGRRKIPSHIERNLIFLVINQRKTQNQLAPCWDQKDCQQREECPAWEFQSGHLCWYLCGTLCGGTSESTYKEKIDICRSCNIFNNLLFSESHTSIKA